MTRAELLDGVQELARRHHVFNSLLTDYGPPPVWQRTQSFRTLVHIILEQKVSIVSALAVMQRVDSLCSDFTPEAFLALSPDTVKDAGVSERKVQYCRSVAEALISGALDLRALRKMPEDEVLACLISVRGIGPWTAGVYNLMALGRTDAWASGDRALALSVQESWNLDTAPDYQSLDQLAESWRPWRGIAARMLWHAYLSRRRQIRTQRQ